MPNIQVGRTSYRRGVARAPYIDLRNRFFERNPVLNDTDDFPSLISRPRMKKFAEVGSGHVRKIFSEPGTFSDSAFVVSGLDLYSLDIYGTSTLIGTISTDVKSSVSMAATAAIGDPDTGVPEYLFLADGGVLWVYTTNGGARGHLQASGAIANNDVVEIGGVYYKFTNGGVDAGTPAGTSGNPWLVNFTGVNATDLTALYHAINANGEAGTEYTTAIVAHATVVGYSVSTADLYVAAKEGGTAGNSITTTETGANLAWEAATLEDGGTALLRQVPTPEDIGAISVAHINSYVIVVPIQSEGYKGRFYWIEPGEITIDPLNFATAERSPDPVHQVIVFSDRFWLMGQSTTEAWVTTGNLTAPMQRFAGILYDRGSWEGTAIKVKDSLIVVDEDGAVFQIGSGLRRLTKDRPDIEERIRKAIGKAAFAGT